MTERSVDASVKSMLLNNEPFDYCHLIKFERPSRPDSNGKVSTSKERYTYISDASIDVVFDDGSKNLAGLSNGPQTYIANKVLKVGNISEEIEATASTYSLILDGTAVGAEVSDTVTTSIVSTGIYDIQFTADLITAGFREGDKVTITGILDPGDYNIISFRANNVVRFGKIDTTLSTPQSNVSITMRLASEEIKSILLDKNASEYSSFLNREVFVWKAFFQNGTIVGTPVLVFKGLISNSSFEENEESVKVTWGLTSHWGDWSQVAGRITSDDFHRALDENGNPNPGSTLKPLYAYDKGFAHAETSINLLAKYTVMVDRQDITVKKGFLGIGSKVKVKKYKAPEERSTALDFQLQAKSIPVIYGVRPTEGIPVFADTLNNDTSKIYVVYAISEGEISSIYDIYIEGNSLICGNKADYDARSQQNPDNTVPLVCIGRADRGDVLGGSVAFSNSFTSYYADKSWLYDLGYNLLEQLGYTTYTPPVETAPVTQTGIKDGETLTLTSPQSIIIDFFSGKEAQKAAQSLVNIAKAENFKIQNDYWTGTDTAEYWGPNHRLLDTAYVVVEYTIKEGETTIPDMQFIVNGKVLPCYNYDYSYSHYWKATGENASNFKLGDYVDVHRSDNNAVINSAVQIIDKWTFYTPDGQANTRFRLSTPPALGYVNGVPSITKFYLKSGANTWTMVSYNHKEDSGQVSGEISSPLTSASNGAGKLVFNFTSNTQMNVGGDPSELSPKFSIVTTGSLPISNEKFGTAILSGVDTSSSLTTEMSYATFSAYATAAISGNKLVSRNTIKLATTASATNDFYNGSKITVTRVNSLTGKQVVQEKTIIGYDGSTKIATIDGVWDLNYIPTTTDTYYITQNYIDHRVSNNFAMQALDYITSITYGRGLSVSTDIDLPSWLQAARVCDAQSDVTVRLSGATAPSTGDVYKFVNTAGNILWQGTVASSFTSTVPGSLTTFVTFTNVIGKLTNYWNSWRTFAEGELVYYGNNVYKTASGYVPNSTAPVHTSGTVNGLIYQSSISITKVTGSGPVSLGMFSAGNPIQSIRNNRLSTGYSLYDSDGVDYWRYLGWDGPEQRYVTKHQGNLVIDTSVPVFENINTILSHFGGMLRYSGGKYFLDVETQADPISTSDSEPYNITEDHIVGKINLTDEGIRSSYNSLAVSYADPSNKFEARNISFFNSDYLKADRNVPRKGSLSIPGITNYYNARLLADKYLTKSRYGLVISMTIAPRGLLLVPGQVIQLQYSRYGWVNKKFRIESMNLAEDCLVDIVAREYDDKLYAISNVSKQEGAGLSGNPVTPVISPPTNLSASQLAGADDTKVTVNLTWDNSSTATPSGTDIEIYSAAKDLTITNISSSVLTCTNHGLALNDPVVFFTSTNGLTAGVTYLAVPTGVSTFTLTDINGNAVTLSNGSGLTLKAGVEKLLTAVTYPISKYADIIYALTGAQKYYRVRNKVFVSGSANYSDFHPVRTSAAVYGATVGVPESVTGYLTNEAATLTATNAGVVTDFSPADGGFQVFSGTTNVTNSSAFSIVVATGCTATINATTGIYSVTAMSADSASVVFRAIYNGITLQKTLSLSKSKAGTSGTSGTNAVDIYLTKNSAAVFAYANGDVPSWAGIDGFVKVFSGGVDVTASATYSSVGSTGLTGSVNTADNTPNSGQVKGYYKVGGLTDNSGTLTISVTYNSVVYQKVFTVNKILTGYEIVSTLPSTNLFQGRMVFLSSDNKLYRYTGTAWTTAVPAVDISGTIADAQIAALNASKLAGQITTTQIADDSISTPKIKSLAIESGNIASGAVIAGKIGALAVNTAELAANAVTAIKINSNAITTDKIEAGAVIASKIGVTELSAIAGNVGTLTAGVIRATDNTFRLELNAAGGPYWRATNFTNMLISGWGIGSTSQYLMWAGPYNSNVNAAAVNNSNAKFYIDYAGNAYFSGTLGANIITATNIVSNSLIKSWTTVVTYTVTWNLLSTPVQIITNTVTTSAGPVDIDIYLNISYMSNSSNAAFDLYRDGTLIDTNGMYALAGTPQYQPAAFTFRDVPGAGSHTYTLYGRPVGGNYTQSVNKCTMRITDNKTES